MRADLAPIMRCILSIVVLGAAAGTAHADDNGSSRFGGDSYVYFHEDKPILGSARSMFRRDNPNGLPVSEYQRLSSPGPTWQPGPAIDKTPATFRRTHPHGLAFGEYQALSSNSAMWMPDSVSSAVSSESNRQRAVPKSASR
jgi:hypothetical protein